MRRLQLNPAVLAVLAVAVLLPVRPAAAAAPAGIRFATSASGTVLLGSGWAPQTPVVVVVTDAGQAAGAIAGLELRTDASGRFRLAVGRTGGACGPLGADAADLHGHLATALPQASCPLPGGGTVHISLHVVKGTRLHPKTTRISFPPPHPTVHLRAGEVLSFTITGSPQPFYIATVNPTYLLAIAAGPVLARPCAAPDCGAGYRWRWVAMRPGVTIVDLAARCRQSHPPCMVPDYGLQVDIGPATIGRAAGTFLAS